jgi:selenoprotein W-related protein
VKVQIEYCADCGYGPRAVKVVDEILNGIEYGPLSSLTLIPSEGGVFEVFFDNELIHSKANGGKFPAPGVILEKLKARIAARTS